MSANWIRTLAIAATFSFSLLSCNATTKLTGGETSKRLVAVSNFLHPPFSSRNDVGEPVGIEVELISKAAADLGAALVWEEYSFSELIEAVVQGEADVAASTLGITEERARRVTFTDSYFSTRIVALTRLADGEPRTLDQLTGKRVGTERGTTSVGATVKRIPGAKRVLDRPTNRTWAQMLGAGEIDAIVIDESHAPKFMADAGATFHIIEEPLRIERFALAVHHDARELLAALNAAIAEHVAN